MNELFRLPIILKWDKPVHVMWAHLYTLLTCAAHIYYLRKQERHITSDTLSLSKQARVFPESIVYLVQL